jgi:hypothetical protein
MKAQPITGAEFFFKKEYAKPFGPMRKYAMIGMVDAYIVDADQEHVYVDFLHYKDNGQMVNRKYYFHPLRIPYSAIQNMKKDDIIRHFHPDNPVVQQEFKFESKTFKQFIKGRK